MVSVSMLDVCFGVDDSIKTLVYEESANDSF